MDSYRQVSPELIRWVSSWIESSYKIDEKILAFEDIRAEAEVFLNVSYPQIYRGLSITEKDADEITLGNSITIPSKRLQSWTKSRSIANDFALPGYGGDVGILVRKTGKQVKVVLDIENVIRQIGRKNLKRIFSQDQITDSTREREVVVETNGTLVIHPKDILKIR